MTVLSLSNVSKRFGPTVALDGVNLQMRQGEVHALIGENGAGKSTLMNVLAGLIHADEGEMSVEGAAYLPANPLDARERGIGLIHQELSLFPHLSVAENIMMGIEPSRFGVLDAKSLAQRTNEVLATFHHPEITPSARVSNLSIAARQIVEICRAIAARAHRTKPPETILAVRDLSAPNLKHATFQLKRGEILGVAGLMGSGRTELIRSLFALDQPTKGTIEVEGKTVEARSGTAARRLSQKFGYLSEDRKGEGLAVTLSIADNVTMTRFAACSRSGWLSLPRQRKLTRAVTSSLSIKARDAEQPVITLS